MRRVHRRSSLLITFWLGRVAGIEKETVARRTMPLEDAGLSTWLASMVENFRPPRVTMPLLQGLRHARDPFGRRTDPRLPNGTGCALRPCRRRAPFASVAKA
jgi:hypothetical protein